VVYHPVRQRAYVLSSLSSSRAKAGCPIAIRLADRACNSRHDGLVKAASGRRRIARRPSTLPLLGQPKCSSFSAVSDIQHPYQSFHMGRRRSVGVKSQPAAGRDTPLPLCFCWEWTDGDLE
jgi:hypothetical protein